MSWVDHTSGQTLATNQKAARSRAQEIDVDRRRDTFYDRASGRVTLQTWLPRWWTTLDLDEVTLDNYRYLVDRHIAPRFGACALNDILASDIS